MKAPNPKPSRHWLWDRTVLLVALLFGMGAALLLWHGARLQTRLVESTSLESARRYSDALREFRTLYTREVVTAAQSQGVVVTHDYDQEPNRGKAIPLPATLSMLIGNELAQNELGGKSALYSAYPFPMREAEWQERDQFAKDAWMAVVDQSDQAFYRFEEREGAQWLRFATADLMRESCVGCHNTHPESPKRDWSVGDVRGVLEVSIPLDVAVAQSTANLRESSLVMLIVGLLALIGVFVVSGRMRVNAAELQGRVLMMTDELIEKNDKLERSHQRFQAMVEAAPTAIVMVDRRGSIVLVNARTEEIFGYDRAELVGQTMEILVPERFRAQHPGHRAAFHANPKARRMGAGRDLFGLRRGGTEFPIEIGLNPVETEEGLFVLSAIIDITERKRLEDTQRKLHEELRERTTELARSKDALEQSNDELQQFAYIASHDLQAPLRGISNFAQFLREDYEGQLDEQADDHIAGIVGGVDRMQQLIRDLLAFSRVDLAKQAFGEVDLGHVFHDAVSLLEASIDESGGQVTCADLPTVNGDPAQLSQLLQNLIGNGLKYHGEAPPQVHVSADQDGDVWTIAVRDEGIGIPAKHHEQVFEILRRLHTKEQYPGTGIGLTVCRRIVERHGGRIWVESEPGLGSTFYFTIPKRAVGDRGSDGELVTIGTGQLTQL